MFCLAGLARYLDLAFCSFKHENVRDGGVRACFEVLASRARAKVCGHWHQPWIRRCSEHTRAIAYMECADKTRNERRNSTVGLSVCLCQGSMVCLREGPMVCCAKVRSVGRVVGLLGRSNDGLGLVFALCSSTHNRSHARRGPFK